MKTKAITYGYLLGFVLFSLYGQAQENPSTSLGNSEDARQARELIIEGTEVIQDQATATTDFDAFAKAESKLRKAIALVPESVPAKYNAGNNYYRSEKWEESKQALINAADVAVTKKEKHKAFHNLGNAFYQQKQFEAAVEAYKDALRNDPTDEETRYNLQLAKKEQEKNGGGGGGGDDDQNEEKKDQNENQEKNEKDQDGEGDQKESDDGEEKETDNQGDEKKDQGEQEKDENGKPEEKEQDQNGGEGDNEEKKPQQQQPQQGQLSPQQVQSLLKAMQDQEQKTQEKINAQKVKGARVKTEKDW